MAQLPRRGAAAEIQQPVANSLITHRMGLEELVTGFGMVTKFDECIKIQVVPHKA